MKNIIFRLASDNDMPQIIDLQTKIFNVEQKIAEIYTDARDITATIICKMGGQIVGEPQPFYVGTVTPVVLKKSNYHHYIDSIN